jgi:hypothetical protein
LKQKQILPGREAGVLLLNKDSQTALKEREFIIYCTSKVYLTVSLVCLIIVQPSFELDIMYS